MNRLMAVLAVLLTIVCAVSAQDWRSDDDNDMQFNCEVVSALKDKAGAKSLIRTEEGEQQSLAGFLDYIFPACTRQDSLRLAELIDSEEEEWVVVLYDKVSHEWGEPECSILIDDFYDEHFTFIIGGYRLDGLALDVYLPGELEAVEMDHVVEDIVREVPVRYEILGGDQFPLGKYVFDVHVDDDIYHFLWNRTDNAMNTVSLSCLGRQEEGEGGERRDGDGDDSAMVVSDAETSAPSASESAGIDNESEIIELVDSAPHQLEEEGCLITLDSNYEENFNVTVIGRDQDGLSVDVYLPDEREPLVMDGSHDFETEIGATFPARIEWAEGDSFPLGVYRFDVHIENNTFHFQWEREDEAFRSFTLACFGAGSFIPELKVLGDDENTYIPDTDCLIWTEAWDVDFNILIVGENQDEMTVEITFPGEEEPEDMDGVSSNNLENGTPYRVEWIEGSVFPLGLFNIDVTIEGQLYQYQWQREDQEVNTFGVECITFEDG